MFGALLQKNRCTEQGSLPTGAFLIDAIKAIICVVVTIVQNAP